MTSRRARSGLLLAVAIAAGCAFGSAFAQKGGALPTKPGAPLAVAVDIPEPLTPGAVAVARVRITATADLADVRLTLAGSAGLEVAVTAFAVGTLERGDAWTQSVDILPLVAGRHRLDLFVTADSPVFGRVARSVAKPIAAGDGVAGAAAAGSKAVDRLRRMPAMETVR